MGKIVKLGESASTFVDIRTGFNISGKQVTELTDAELKSKKTSYALKNGHLAPATEEELKDYQSSLKTSSVEASGDVKQLKKAIKEKDKALVEKEAENEGLKAELAEAKAKLAEAIGGVEGDPEENLSEKTKPELIQYYKDNFEVTKEDIAAFSKLDKEAMLTELSELSEDEE